MRYNFKSKTEAFDEDRAGFANRVCKLIYNQNNNDIDKAIIECGSIYSDFDEHIRNIYELIDNYIPLMAYYELKKYGADNFGLNDNEYDVALQNSKKACEDYYS